MNTLYEHCYYRLRETKKPTYLDFYELDVNDLHNLECYLNQTIRFQNKWYFLEMKKKYFYTEKERDATPKYMMKPLYKPERELF